MIVWVSGASSGLGFHTSLQLKNAGMTVFSGARSYRDQEGEGENGYRLYLDVKEEASMDRFAEQALSLAGPPDVLCCCAGVLTLGACEDYSLQELRDVMETNFFGQAMMIRRVLPLMRANGGGKIVLFSSVNGVLAVPYQGAYTASKHAVEGFADSIPFIVVDNAEELEVAFRLLKIRYDKSRGKNEAYVNSRQLVYELPYFIKQKIELNMDVENCIKHIDPRDNGPNQRPGVIHLGLFCK